MGGAENNHRSCGWVDTVEALEQCFEQKPDICFWEIFNSISYDTYIEQNYDKYVWYIEQNYDKYYFLLLVFEMFW